MKQFTYLFLIIIFFSCAHEKKRRHYNDAVYDVNANATNKVSVPEKYTYEKIVKQKLENYIELLKLKELKPALESDIEKQLKDLSATRLHIRTDAVIEDIHQVGEVKIVSDSVQRIKLKFTMLYNIKKVEDSIYAFIKYSNIILDGKKIRSNKIILSKE